MKTVAKYINKGNAAFVLNHLLKKGIIAELIETTEINEDFIYNILVKESDFSLVKNEINKLDIIDNKLEENSKGYLDGHKELNDNLYNTGYYSGGRTPHHLFDSENQLYYLLSFLGIGVCMLISCFINWDFIFFLIGVFSLTMFGFMYLKYRNNKRN